MVVTSAAWARLIAVSEGLFADGLMDPPWSLSRSRGHSGGRRRRLVDFDRLDGPAAVGRPGTEVEDAADQRLWAAYACARSPTHAAAAGGWRGRAAGRRLARTTAEGPQRASNQSAQHRLGASRRQNTELKAVTQLVSAPVQRVDRWHESPRRAPKILTISS